MPYTPPLRQTNLDVLQIIDANCYEYIDKIKSYRDEAIYLIQETFNIHNIRDINDLRFKIMQNKRWTQDNETAITERINTIDTDIQQNRQTVKQINQRIKFVIMKDLYYNINQAFVQQLEWLNLQYDEFNNFETITNLEMLTIKGQHWVWYLEYALIKAQEYKNLLRSPQQDYDLANTKAVAPPLPHRDYDLANTKAIAPRLPPPKPRLNPETSLASSLAAFRLGRSATRSASRIQRPIGGGMATRKKLYRKRNKRQIKRYTKKYRIHY